jgi:hypothetical protein
MKVVSLSMWESFVLELDKYYLHCLCRGFFRFSEQIQRAEFFENIYLTLVEKGEITHDDGKKPIPDS